MKVVALMPVRNEAWVLGFSARVALMWCDEIVFASHWPEDRSHDIMNELAADYPGRVTIREDRSQQWHEMRQRQMLLECARERGATHIALVDADEVLTANLLDGGGFGHCCPKGMIETGSGVLQLPGYNLRGSLNRYHSNGIWANRWFSVAFSDDKRLHWGGDKFHQREPRGMKLELHRPIAQGEGGVLHLWGVSERRLVAKHSWYKVTERIRFPEKAVSEIDRMYNLAIKGEFKQPTWGTPATWTYAEVPEAWLSPYARLMQYLDIDATPWQEEETRRLVREHGREAFNGLDLFGVV